MTGRFETIGLNAPGGIADYALWPGGLYRSIAASRQHDEAWSAQLIEHVETERKQHLPRADLASRRDWRDQALIAMAAERKNRMPPPVDAKNPI